MAARHAGRGTRRWRALKVKFKELCRLESRPCWLCGQAIDYDLPHDHPDAFSVDHRFPVSTHRHLGDDPANLEASHARCNKSRGAKAQPMQLGSRSRAW
jgi:5-methylcytosine-specific restriction endonuclease McrA